jgi:hypothetical protein
MERIRHRRTAAGVLERSRGPIFRWLVAALAAAILLPAQARARELVPFPSQQQAPNSPVQQSVAPTQGYYLTEFDRSIAEMDCGQLQALKTRLAENRRTASTRADQEYFAQLIGRVDQRRNARNCRP